MKSILILLFLSSFSFSSFASETKSKSKKIEIEVKGMVCDFCARGLEKLFGKKEEIKSIDVNLEKGLVKLEFKDGKNLDDKTIEKIILSNGISVSKVNRNTKK